MESRFHRIFVAAAFLLLSVCFCIEGKGQTTVTYSYDSAGNRIGRSSGVGRVTAGRSRNFDSKAQVGKATASKQADTLNGRDSSASGSAVESAAHILSTHSAPISTLDSVQSLQNQQRKISLVKTAEEKVLHSEEYRRSLMEAEEEAFGIRSAATPRTDRSAYTVGGISLESGITPSGARTYSIPIAAAAGLKLAPSVAIGYNSQAGEGWAGYGWDIQGLPSISLVNKNIYYHGKAEAASVEDKAAAFALDGVPLVANDDLSTSATFPLETASGHILVAPAKSASGYVTGFTALYPDVVTAVFRPCQTDTCQSPSYPIAEMSDLDGNRVVFNYLPDVSGGNPRISSIQYGLNGTDACLGETVFSYNLLQYRPVRYYAGRLVRRPYRLSSIVTRSGGERTGRYSLSYEENDGVSLLTKVEYSSMTESLPPLEFEYGGGADPDSAAHIFRKNNPLFLTSSFTRDVDVHYKRGKFVRDSHNDGLLIYPAFSEYGVTKHRKPLFGHNYYEFGSLYSKDQKILFAPSLTDFNLVDDSITAGEGFQTIEAVDADGDGIDELVKVNFDGTSVSYTWLLITVYKCDDSGLPAVAWSFRTAVKGVVTSGDYVSPVRIGCFWGDFTGDGKAQLLTVAYDKNYNSKKNYDQESYATLIDIDGRRKLTESVLFSFPIDRYGCIVSCDIDNDTRTELCYATDSGFDVYRVQPSGAFGLEASYSDITAEILSSSERPYQITDINDDGYADILVAPRAGTSTTWISHSFTGTGFSTYYLDITSRADGDTFMFIDINRDGLPDLVKAGGTSIGASINRGVNLGTSRFGDFLPSPSPVEDCKGIIPANVVDYTGSSAFIKVDGFYAYEYSCTSLVPEERHLTRVVDSFGKESRDTYAYLPTHSLYWTDNTVSVSASDGYALRTLPVYVLSREETFLSEGVEASRCLDRHHSYFDGVVHCRGLGFCGFSRIRTYDYTGSVPKVIDRTYDPEKRGTPSKVELRLGSMAATPHLTTEYTFDGHTTVYGGLNPRLVRSVTTDGLTGIETAVNYSYDGYDCPTSVLTSRRAGSSAPMTESVFRTYLHNVETSRYVTGLVTEERVVKKDEGNTSPAWEERRTVAYDSLSHPRAIRRYVGETAVSGTRNDALNLVSETLLSYDGHGNMVSEMTAPYGAEEYTGDTYVYDGDGRYLLSKTDALGYTTAYGGYNRFGKPATETDYRGRVTSFTYDEFGNLVKTEHPDGSEEETASVWGGAGLYTVTDTRSDGPTRSVCFDALGRETRSGTIRFDGRWQYIDRVYDSEGRLSRVSLPFRGSQAVYWNTYSYDEYGRQVGLAEASGKVASWAYDGLSVTTVKDGVTSTRTTDANGGVVCVTDGGGTITYALRNDGQPSSVTAPGNAVTTFSYDGYGRRTVIDDPCAGIRTDTCVWNGDGSSVLTHTGPDGTVVTRKDKYGRTVSVERPGEYDTAYSYDEYSLPSVEQSTNGVRTEYAYDDFDRISKIDESIADVILRKVYFYRPGGGLSSIMYVVGEELVATENFGYANGHNTEVTLSDSTVVRRLVSENDLGMATEVITGGISRRYGFTDFGLPVYRRMDDGDLQDFAYRFDPLTGNLLSRADSLNGRTETFGYDSLDRLTLMGRMQVGYSDNGNIVSVDGVGTMGYESSGGPYRVTSFSPEYGGLVRDRAQTVSYTSFDRPSTLAEGGRTVSFTYDGAGNRVKMHVTDEEGYELTRFYLGGRYERDQTLEGVKERLYLGGDVYSAPMVLQRWNDGGWVAYNIGRDYLGSVTHIATLDGTLVAGYSYDPWGRLRDPRTLEIYAAGEEPELFLGRGFTGHEHLPWFGLVNMNARLYDPLLGRFLSPDPYVQTPDFTQSFNRYSYALNNPLKYTDENGEFVLTTMLAVAGITAAIFGVGNLTAHAIRNDYLGHWNWARYFFSGTAAGFVVGAMAYTGWSGILEMSRMAGFIGAVGKTAKYGAIGVEGLHIASTVTGVAGGLVNNGWEGVGNSAKVLLGNFYLDENASFFSGVWQGISRHTWETLQTGLGYDYTQFRNAFGSSIDRVDYLGGATFATNEYSKYNQGITLGNYCNMDVDGKILDDFTYYITRFNAMYMHEYGHTIDGRKNGVAYLFTVGIPSIFSAKNSHNIGRFRLSHSYEPYERRANRLAEKYFGANYGVNWLSAYPNSNSPWTIADYYPL